MSTPRLQQIVKRDGTLARYDRRRIETAIFKATCAIGKPDQAFAARAALNVEAALMATYVDANLPTVEDIQDVVERVLVGLGTIDVAQNYITYRRQHAMLRAARANEFAVSDNIPYRKIYDVLRWNIDHGCETVAGLNRIIRRGEYPDLVAAGDRRYVEDIRRAATIVLERRQDVRIVIVAGPSSSGKTTTTIKLSNLLAESGIGFRAIGVDHYFFDLEQHPRDEYGDYDYETPQALDLELINEHLEQLLAGREIKTPHYDFKTGKRTLNVHPFRLKKNEVLLIDSLHGLYDGMTSRISPKNKFKLYIETLGQFRAADGNFMRWADNRLLRRMIRDRDNRNQKPIETLTHWHYVRRSELHHIIPYLRNADYVVNSALPYELPLLKQRLFRYVVKARDQFRDDPKRLDAHIRANRVFDLLKPIRTVRDETCVPADALIREFIGGSCYTY
ncbi:MAG: response regulator SirA [Lentisphaerae bacterium]|nr:response regulator SirA [Lentisphaerota bacterium]